MDFMQMVRPLEIWLRTFVLSEWTFYQLGIIAAGYVFASFVASRTEPAMESRARRIKGNPDLLRVIIAFMRRLKWLFLTLWLWLASVILKQGTWPSQRWLIATALSLAAAWFIISVLTKIIRNPTLSRLVAMVSWGYLAVYATGLDGPILSALDAAAVNLGVMRLSLLIVLKAVVLTVALI
ncbi:mechanosensitive ion channel family protein, partial [Sinorhizobium meliloti]